VTSGTLGPKTTKLAYEEKVKKKGRKGGRDNEGQKR